MRTAAESDMRFHPGRGIEFPTCSDPWIKCSGVDQEMQGLAARYRPTAELELLKRLPRYPGGGRPVPNRFLNAAGNQVRVATNCRPLLRMFGEKPRLRSQAATWWCRHRRRPL